jgi:hypothetical protein
MQINPDTIMKMFVSRKDVFAQQINGGGYVPIRREITLQDIQNHLDGEITLGLYCLDTDSTIRWACVDIDGDENDLLKSRLSANHIYDLFPDFERMLEFSGRRGYHIWLFFKTKQNPKYIQTLVKARLDTINEGHHEVFPKQTELNETTKFGNLVKLICGVHKKTGKRSVILKMDLKSEVTE